MKMHLAVKKALLLLLTLVLAAMWVTTTTAAINPEESNLPDAVQKVQPPPSQQGGTCLSGSIINRSYQPAGAGWTVQISSSEGQTQLQTADAGGEFRFEELTAGDWQVALEIPDGWQAFTPAAFPITLSGEGSNCASVRFQVESQFACVDVYKTDSIDGAGLAGWEISIKPSDGGLTIADITDGTGWVRFNELAPGSYTISERPQDGWQALTPISTTVQLEANGACGLVRFENQPETLPPQLEAAPEAGSKKEAGQHGCHAKYRVRAGDTLFRIAKRHETSLTRLVRLNRIANPDLIYTGQMICIR